MFLYLSYLLLQYLEQRVLGAGHKSVLCEGQMGRTLKK